MRTILNYKICQSLILIYTLISTCFSCADIPDVAKYIFIIPNFKSQHSGMASQLADAIQLRLRRKLKKYQINAYVFAPVEIQAYDSIDELIKSITLKQGQKLFLVNGTFRMTPARQAIAKINVRVFTKNSSYLMSQKTFTGQGTRWRWHISRRVVSFLISDALSFTPPKPAKQPELIWASSIVPNGSFEHGIPPYKPAHWDTVDNLCSFWVKSDKGGRCIKFDTNVSQQQAWDWWKELKKGAKPQQAPNPIHTNPPHYDAVGGIEGVKLYSDYIPVKMGKKYKLSAKIKGPTKGQAKIFIKAYAMLPTAKNDKLIKREVWNMYMHCNTNNNDWHEYSQIFSLPKTLPQVRKKHSDGTIKYYSPEIEWIRIMLYAYWSVGDYYFDDIRIFPAIRKSDNSTQPSQNQNISSAQANNK